MSPEEVRAAKLRQRGMLVGLKDLLAAHREFKADERLARTIIVGDVLLGAILVGGVLALVGFSWGGVALAIVLAGGVLWLLLRRRHYHALQALLALRKQADRIVAEYADEAQAWGGKNALLNADIVREIIAAMETDMGSPATP